MATDIEHLLCGQVGGWAGGGRWCCCILQMRMGVQLSGEWPRSLNWSVGLRILGKASRSWGAGEMGFLRPEPLGSLVILPHVQKILESLRLRETCLTASLSH